MVLVSHWVGRARETALIEAQRGGTLFVLRPLRFKQRSPDE